MSVGITIKEQKHIVIWQLSYINLLALLAVLILAGCKISPPTVTSVPQIMEQQAFELEQVGSEQCTALLARLGLNDVVPVPDENLLLVSGSLRQLHKAKLVLELVDTTEDYCIENLGPASEVRSLPSNPNIAKVLGDINIGTFAYPPQKGEESRAIIDIYGDSVLAIIPVQYREQLLALMTQTTNEKESISPLPALSEQKTLAAEEASQTIAEADSTEPNDTLMRETLLSETTADGIPGEGSQKKEIELLVPSKTQPTTVFTLSEFGLSPDDSAQEKTAPTSQLSVEESHSQIPKTTRIILKPPQEFPKSSAATTKTKLVELQNSEDILEMALPETITLIQLLDLVGKQFDFDYVYDQGTFKNESVTLKLHGELRGEMKGRDLYTLLETVLKFKSLAMTRRENNLVTIVPIDQALETDPQLVDIQSKTIQAGNTVVTYIFELQYVDVASVTSLLKDMKLGVTVTPLEETQLLFVTCYAHRMSRIERLVNMLDRPGKYRECRFRRLQYVTASPLVDKIRTLSKELPGIQVTTSSIESKPPPQPIKVLTASLPAESQAFKKITKQPVYLDTDERTNRILMIGYEEELTLIEELIDVLDIAQEDLRTLEVYEIQHVDAEVVKKKIEDLNLLSIDSAAFLTNSSNEPPKPESGRLTATSTTETITKNPQVVVNESTNALLVHTTPQQHNRIAKLVNYVDSKIPEEEISYKIYPLENSSPRHVADLLDRLIQEKANEEDDKIETVAKREERITIVPDPNTFSLIVYASQKNQKWIEDLTQSLDQRRPQVLIDVTLVEITRTDTFEYDLNLVANAKDAVIGNIGIDPIHTIDSGSRLEAGFNLLDQEGNPTGQTKAFFSDEKVQALLTAIRRKNYGRVLAKPKILVDDGQEGEISTIDETTYLKESIQVPDQGAPITTRNYELIEAKLQLQIVPHISEGNLLRLDVHLSREDFGTRPAEGAPPDKATSQVNTTVFVPDNHTVILGGLVKLNQSKGGSKVPILGDIPLIGALFRSVDNSDVEKKLYVFLKANIVRPSQEAGLGDLQKVSLEHQEAFEESEAEFQKHENIPGRTPKPMQPEGVLKDYK